MLRVEGIYIMAKKKQRKVAKKAVPKEEVAFRTDEELKKAEAYLGSAVRTLPLPQSFFITSILGLIIAAFLTLSRKLDPTWGFAFCLVFVMMFIASFVTIHPKEEYHK